VALARTLAAHPRLILLDEPLASVDPELRTELRAEFRRVLAHAGVSVLYVTHDREEGLFLGDRVILLEAGRIAQAGRPDEVFRAPATSGVARFLGYNVLRIDGRLEAVHPTAIILGAPGASRTIATVLVSGPVGEGWVAYASTGDGSRWEVRGAHGVAPSAGTQVGLDWERSVPLRE
jgi:ABC-type sulfate/molybdate transport systems ATPase subunit